jgi:hypothetical protein
MFHECFLAYGKSRMRARILKMDFQRVASEMQYSDCGWGCKVLLQEDG